MLRLDKGLFSSLGTRAWSGSGLLGRGSGNSAWYGRWSCKNGFTALGSKTGNIDAVVKRQRSQMGVAERPMVNMFQTPA